MASILLACCVANMSLLACSVSFIIVMCGICTTTTTNIFICHGIIIIIIINCYNSSSRSCYCCFLHSVCCVETLHTVLLLQMLRGTRFHLLYTANAIISALDVDLCVRGIDCKCIAHQVKVGNAGEKALLQIKLRGRIGVHTTLNG